MNSSFEYVRTLLAQRRALGSFSVTITSEVGKIMTFEEFRARLVEQTTLHGRDALVSVSYPQEKQMGFRSPDGEWVISLGEIKSYFGQEEWRANSEAEDKYRDLGGVTPIRSFTRLPPNEVLSKRYGQELRKAIEEGLDLRSSPSG